MRKFTIYAETNTRMKNAFLLLLAFPLFLPAQQSRPPLFLDTDKSLYVSNEYLWFTAFQLHATVDDPQNTTLHVVLSDAADKKPVLYNKYVMDRGIAMGSMRLPDSLSGEYFLLAYTDHYFKNGKEPVFSKWISIRSKKQKPRPIPRIIADSCIAVDTPGTRFVNVLLDSDSLSYYTRSQTKWKIRLTGENGQALQGVFSISCALTRRFAGRFEDISKYFYAYNACVPLPIDQHLADAPDSIFGTVTRGDKPLKKPTSLVVLGEGNATPLLTRSDGSFAISSDQLAANGESVIISLTGTKFLEQYNLQLNDKIDDLNTELSSRQFPIGEPDTSQAILTEEDMEHQYKVLKEAVVTAKQELYIDGEPVLKDSSCDAWVCVHGHIYCDNSPRGGRPEIGKVYYDAYRNHKFVLYKGCSEDYELKSFMKKIPATQHPRKFFSPDYCNGTNTEPQLNTTLYWNYLIATDKNGEADFKFYTNDLTGYFTCTIQGLTTAGPVSARKEILVMNKKGD